MGLGGLRLEGRKFGGLKRLQLLNFNQIKPVIGTKNIKTLSIDIKHYVDVDVEYLFGCHLTKVYLLF